MSDFDITSATQLADVLGDHLFRYFLANKRREWSAYTDHVTRFELERYLPLL